jgi:hypothetical protein
VALKGHEVLFGGNTEGGDGIRGHKREKFRIVVGFEGRGNNDQEESGRLRLAMSESLGSSVRVGESSSRRQSRRRLAIGTCGTRTGKWV